METTYENIPFEPIELEETEEQTYIPLKEHKYLVVSEIAYLIGVDKKYFGEDKIYKTEIFNKFNVNKNARIIRNLCRLRTAIELRYKVINDEFKAGRDVFAMTEFIPEDAIMELSNDGIRIVQKARTYPVNYIIEINKLIQDRINNCKNLLPEWLNWQYVKDIFIMPDGITPQGTAAAAGVFYENKNCYPFHIYLNWPPYENGNILLNDKKFVQLLYENNGDEFTQISKVMDVSGYVKSNIYDFLDNGTKIDMIVDCENSDVYNIISMLRSLEWEDLKKVSKIILINDVNTNLGWGELEKCTDIPVEHIMTQRVKEDKSLVDGMVIAKTYEEFYENNVDSFILLSSDSDYWALISMLKKAKFLVMVEHTKCGPDLKEKLEENCIFYCYLDDFYSGEEAEEMKRNLLLKQIGSYLAEKTFNMKDLLENSLLDMRIEMTAAQKKQFYDKHLKPAFLTIDENGRVQLNLK